MSEAEAHSDSLYSLLTALDLVTTAAPPLGSPLTLLLLILPSAGVQLLTYLKLKPSHFVVSPRPTTGPSFPPQASSQTPFLPLAAVLRCQG